VHDICVHYAVKRKACPKVKNKPKTSLHSSQRNEKMYVMAIFLQWNKDLLSRLLFLKLSNSKEMLIT
jgi:hypothetical protein